MNIVDIIKKKIEIAEEIDALNSNSEEHIACEKALMPDMKALLNERKANIEKTK